MNGLRDMVDDIVRDFQPRNPTCIYVYRTPSIYREISIEFIAFRYIWYLVLFLFFFIRLLIDDGRYQYEHSNWYYVIKNGIFLKKSINSNRSRIFVLVYEIKVLLIRLGSWTNYFQLHK